MMAKVVGNTTSGSPKKGRPGLTLESRENQMIALAVDLAEEQLRAGTASSQVITHYLKLGSTREKLEHELKMKELELMDAKKDQIKSMQRSEELMAEAIKAFKNYNGQGDPEDYDDDDEY